MSSAVPAPPISEHLARFAASLRYEEIPEAVRERAKYLMLDATGIALASTREDFARKTLAGLSSLGEGGGHALIGMNPRLPLRDAVVMNGVLVHGLDFDDTHTPGAIHATASAFPCALGVAEKTGADGRALLTAYLIGVETATRLASVTEGGFHQVGFHPTGLVGAFGCVLLAGRLLGLTPEQLVMAQGIVLSTASGSLEFIQDGAWTKRMHPGWAGAGAITAAALAKEGYIAPRAAYEGRFGLFPSHLGEYAADVDYGRATAGLGETWEIGRVAVKPFPACHFAHACADAAIALAREQGVKPADVERIEVSVPPQVVKAICEPEADKKRPSSAYAAQFSVHYITAASLTRGRFGLAELTRESWTDPDILALAAKVNYVEDPSFPFPEYYSGQVAVTTRDGRRLVHREEKNRGAGDRPIAAAEIEAKYLDNATLAVSRSRAESIRDLILTLDECSDARLVANALAGAEAAPLAHDEHAIPGRRTHTG